MKYAFQLRDGSNGWTFDGIGQQDPSNTLDSRAEADAVVPHLAEVLEVRASDLRVVEVTDDFHTT